MPQNAVPPSPATSLVDHIVAFGRVLRRAGLEIGSHQIMDAVRAVEVVGVRREDDVYQALFDRLGIIRVDSPVQLLETLKVLSLAGVPQGRRLAGFAASGGNVTLLADYAEPLNLSFPPPSPSAAKETAALLPEVATVSNPLD